MAENRVYQSNIEIFGSLSSSGGDPGNSTLRVYQSNIEIFGSLIASPTSIGSGCTLYMSGSSPATGNIPLYTRGYDVVSSGITLYSKGHEVSSGNITLYTQGSIASSGNLPLYLHSTDYVALSSGITLYVNGTTNPGISNSLNLFISNFTGSGSLGTSPSSGNLDLYLSGQSTGNASGYLTLFLQGEPASGTGSGTLTLYLENTQLSVPTGSLVGGGIASSGITLYIKSAAQSSGSMPLFLQRKGLVGEEITNNITLFLNNNQAEGNIPLYLNCTYYASSGITLFMPTIGAGTGNLNLYTKGYSE